MSNIKLTDIEGRQDKDVQWRLAPRLRQRLLERLKLLSKEVRRIEFILERDSKR